MPDFRVGGALGADPDDPLLATERMLQGIGHPLRAVDLGLYVQPGYGGIENIAGAAINDINATPQILPSTTGSVITPLDCVQDIVTDGVRFLRAGVWQVAVAFSISFIGVNSARQYKSQIFNQSNSAVIKDTIVSVGRNAEGSNVSSSFLVDVAAPAFGLFSLRLVSDADTFTVVSLVSYSFSVLHVDRSRLS